ncbi:hypothetical protein EXT43_17820 [Pseudoalteromonas sp. CO109Y]|uniref:hypothetical protein n=1 Tax=Pseudoalteromonas sp. CO109Y TaxID=1777235 RepID=UPI001022AE9D|nr:hypothetical protein [Pseudoalteromonas sp. CO109Y]RZF77959.1 hypothetical protein EXT43_17820 [Pseudoalteromonas sp. CO109Y]
MIMKFFGQKEEDKPILSTNTVFKISGVPEHTFVEREMLSEEIDEHLESKDGVLLFLGYSKSGKTVFRKKHIEDKGFKLVTYRGNNKSTIPDLYKQIATQLGLIQVKELQQTRSNSYQREEEEQVGNKNIGHVRDKRVDTTENSINVTSDVSTSDIDINFLCNTLSRKNVLVVLEDYHLVDNEFNKILSEDLKHFLDEEILFLLIGIPSSPNRALRNNPDLSGRMGHISFDYLSREEVKSVVSAGGKLLNISFQEDVVEQIINCSMKNAYLVQYICRILALSKNVKKTAPDKIIISDPKDVDRACIEIAKKLDSDYSSIYNTIASGTRAQQQTKAFNQYEEVLKAIKFFTIEDLEKGIGYRTISTTTWTNMPADKIQKYIDNGTYKSEQSFKSSVNTQVKNAIDKINDNLSSNATKPILYVNDSTLYLTDLIFKFYINWKVEATNA